MITIRNKHDYHGKGEYIGRPSILGNQFSHLDRTLAQFKVATREEAVTKYHIWLRKQYVSNPAVKAELHRLARIAKAGDLVLICWCAPLRCHGEILKNAIERLIAEGKV